MIHTVKPLESSDQCAGLQNHESLSLLENQLYPEQTGNEVKGHAHV